MTNDNKKNEVAAYQKWQNQTNGRHPDASPSTQVPQSARSQGNADLPGICLLSKTTGGGMNNVLGAVLVPGVTAEFEKMLAKGPVTGFPDI